MTTSSYRMDLLRRATPRQIASVTRPGHPPARESEREWRDLREIIEHQSDDDHDEHEAR